MTNLSSIRRPPPSLIKLVESIGILLGIPRSPNKSVYKAPSPSNYDDTMQALDSDFFGRLTEVSTMQSASIDNEIASQFYNKMLEPGFDYEEAVNSGGLMTRELFNAAYLILLRLQNDKARLPILTRNVVVLVDGTRASYSAFDLAAHIHNHGMLKIALLINSNSVDPTNSFVASGTLATGKSHLQTDILRRCKSHYKKADHSFSITQIPIKPNHPQSDVYSAQKDAVVSYLEETACDILVLGMSDYNIGQDSFAKLNLWSVWESSSDVIFVKGMTPTRPFTEANSPRRFLLYLTRKSDRFRLFLKALRFMRPGDTVVVLFLVEKRDPVGDSRMLRFDFGERGGWIKGTGTPAANSTADADVESRASLPTFVGWNDADVEQLVSSAEKLIETSFMAGSVTVDRFSPSCSVGQQVLQHAFDNTADVVFIGEPQTERDTIVECVREANCAIAVLK